MAVSLTEQYAHRKLVAAGTDSLWSESVAGTMTQITAGFTAGDIDTTDFLTLTEYSQKVIVLNGANKGVIEFVDTELVVPAMTTPPAVGDVLEDSSNNATGVVTSVNTAKTKIYVFPTSTVKFNGGSVTNLTGTMSPSTVSVTGTPLHGTDAPIYHSFDVYPDGNAHTVTADTKLYMACNYRGRLVLSGNPDDPFQWYMSRQLDYTDYFYSPNDAQSPVAGANADAGKVGDLIRALIPYHDDYLIFGCASTLWYMQGDPAAGGSLNQLDDKMGIYGSSAYTWDEHGNLWLLTSAGVCRVQVATGGLSIPENMTANRLPKFLDDIGANPSSYRVTMGYDRKRHGIIISVTTVATGVNDCFFYDTRTEGFFPEEYPKEDGIYSQYYYSAIDQQYTDLLVGTKDGYIMKWDDGAKNDDIGDSDTAILSEMVFPIQKLGENADQEGKLNSLTIVLSGGGDDGAFDDTDSVDYSIYVADDAETLMENIEDDATPLYTGTLTGPGRQFRIRDKARGAYLALKLNNSSSLQTWSVENVEGDVITVGRIN